MSEVIISLQERQRAQTQLEINQALAQPGTAETKAAKLVAALDKGLNSLNNADELKKIQTILVENGVLNNDVRRVMTQLDNAIHNASAETGQEQPESYSNESEDSTVEMQNPTDQYESDRAEIIRDTVQELTDDIKRGKTGSAIELNNKLDRWRQEINAFGNDILRTRLEIELDDAAKIAREIPAARKRAA